MFCTTEAAGAGTADFLKAKKHVRSGDPGDRNHHLRERTRTGESIDRKACVLRPFGYFFVCVRVEVLDIINTYVIFAALR